jgi:ankyrin repeat protein
VYARRVSVQLRLVLESGCEVDCRNDRMETPLMACLIVITDHARRASVIRLLLTFGANVNACNSRGQTAIMYACILNQYETVLVLLEEVSYPTDKHVAWTEWRLYKR